VNREQTPLPVGYRQGLITAITVLLGFSLTFLRFWGFEAPGEWTLLAIFSTGILVSAVVLQLVALFRSLQPGRCRQRVPQDDRLVPCIRGAAAGRAPAGARRSVAGLTSVETAHGVSTCRFDTR
jgi:hypothetical protein